eukprot:Em0010g913a
MTAIVIFSSSISSAEESLTVLNGDQDGVKTYLVNTAGHMKQVSSASSPASFNCTTCSRWQNDSFFSDYGHYVKLSQTELLVILNGTLAQTLSLPPECPPSYIVRANGESFNILCKPSARDGWKPKYQPVVLDPDRRRFRLDTLQYCGDAGTVWLHSESNSAIVTNARGDQGCVCVASDSTVRWLDMTTLTPSVIEAPQCTITSVSPLEPADDNYRFTLGCSQGAVKKSYVMDQSGKTDEIPAPLVCESPLVAAPGGRYVLVFCGPSTYIVDLSAGNTKTFVVRNGITMGDQLVFLPGEQVAIVTLHDDITILNLILEYQAAGTGRRKIANTASVARRPCSANRDGKLLSCGTDGTRNWCRVFDVSPAIESITPIATYDLASIRPDAVIVEQGDDLMATTSGNQVPTRHPNPDHNDVIIIVVVVVGVVVVLVVVVVVVGVIMCCKKKTPDVAPQQETYDAPRIPGCGESRDSKHSSAADLANSGDGSSYDIPAPTQLPSPSPPPSHLA